MANKTATLSVSLSYQGITQVIAETPINVASPYMASNVAEVDVPDTTAASTAFAVPFGTIGTDAPLVLVKNETGQDMDVIINGAAAASHSLAPNGILLLANPAAITGLGTPVTSVSLETTAIQSGDGSIKCWAFGDPV